MFRFFRKKLARKRPLEEILSLSGREVNLRGGQVSYNGKVGFLEPLVIDALLFLIANKDRWVSANEMQEELTRDAWGNQHPNQLNPEQFMQRVAFLLREGLGDDDKTLIASRIDDHPPFTEWYKLVEPDS